MADASLSTANAAVEYYVYVYWRSDLSRETPFYVGKGKGSRAWKRDSRNPDFLDIVDNLTLAGMPPRIEVSDLMTEDEAFSLEIELIEFYGRADQGRGPLVNRTLGGEGLRYVAVSEELRTKAREQMAILKASGEIEQRRMAGLRKAAARVELRQRRREAMELRYSDPAAREAHGELMKQVWQREDFRAAQSAGLSRMWEDPVHRAKAIAGIKRQLANGGAEKRSRTMKSKFVGPDGEARRAKVAAQTAARWADPEYRAKMRAANQASWDRDNGARRLKAREKMLSRMGKATP